MSSLLQANGLITFQPRSLIADASQNLKTGRQMFNLRLKEIRQGSEPKGLSRVLRWGNVVFNRYDETVVAYLILS